MVVIAMVVDDETKQKSHSPLVLWFSPVDEYGERVDPIYLEAGYQIGDLFFYYRQHALGDESLAMQLAEQAVHRASRAKKGKPVENPVAYVYETFKHLVDHEIKRARKLLPLTERRMQEGRREPPADWMERGLACEELYRGLSEENQALLWDMNFGTSLPDLANTLGIRPNTLSQRMSRLRKEIQNTLDWNRTKAPISGPDGKPNARRRGPGRIVSLHGDDRAA